LGIRVPVTGFTAINRSRTAQAKNAESEARNRFTEDSASPDRLSAINARVTTRSGHKLHASAVKRSVAWSTVAQGRRIHDLPHTAACLRLSRGVDPVTVQAWLGHASIATTNIYLHHLGSSAVRAGLERLNALGGAGGAHRERNAE